jgi:hypothetical protein
MTEANETELRIGQRVVMESGIWKGQEVTVETVGDPVGVIHDDGDFGVFYRREIRPIKFRVGQMVDVAGCHYLQDQRCEVRSVDDRDGTLQVFIDETGLPRWVNQKYCRAVPDTVPAPPPAEAVSKPGFLVGQRVVVAKGVHRGKVATVLAIGRDIGSNETTGEIRVRSELTGRNCFAPAHMFAAIPDTLPAPPPEEVAPRVYPAGTRFNPLRTAWTEWDPDADVFETKAAATVGTWVDCDVVKLVTIKESDGVFEWSFHLTGAIEHDEEREERLKRESKTVIELMQTDVYAVNSPLPFSVIGRHHRRHIEKQRAEVILSAMLATGGVSDSSELRAEAARKAQRLRREASWQAHLEEERRVAAHTQVADQRGSAKGAVKSVLPASATPSWPSFDSGPNWED